MSLRLDVLNTRIIITSYFRDDKLKNARKAQHGFLTHNKNVVKGGYHTYILKLFRPSPVLDTQTSSSAFRPAG